MQSQDVHLRQTDSAGDTSLQQIHGTKMNQQDRATLTAAALRQSTTGGKSQLRACTAVCELDGSFLGGSFECNSIHSRTDRN